MPHEQHSTDPIIVIDVEASGLDPASDVVTEVAWWRLNTAECGVFIPPHDTAWVLGHGDSYALEISHYRERLANAPQDDGTELLRLGKVLNRNTWCGANPSFDVGFLAPLFLQAGFPPRFWHHRLWDVEAWGAGVLGLNHIPGLYDLCGKLSVEPPDHSAKGDVLATGRCMLALAEIIASRA